MLTNASTGTSGFKLLDKFTSFLANTWLLFSIKGGACNTFAVQLMCIESNS